MASVAFAAGLPRAPAAARAAPPPTVRLGAPRPALPTPRRQGAPASRARFFSPSHPLLSTPTAGLDTPAANGGGASAGASGDGDDSAEDAGTFAGGGGGAPSSRAERDGALRSLDDYRAGVRWSVPEWDTVDPTDGSVTPTYSPGRSWGAPTAKNGGGAGGARRGKERSGWKDAAEGGADGLPGGAKAAAANTAGGRKKGGKSGAPAAAAVAGGEAAASGRSGGRAAAGGGGGDRPPMVKARTLLKTLITRSVASSDTCAALIVNGVVLVDGVVETDPSRKVAPDAQLVVRGRRVREVVGTTDRDAPRSSRPGGDPRAADAAAAPSPVRLPRARRDLGGGWDDDAPREGGRAGARRPALDKKYTWKVDGGFYAGRRRAADK